jgi:hypothetical protein
MKQILKNGFNETTLNELKKIIVEILSAIYEKIYNIFWYF